MFPKWWLPIAVVLISGLAGVVFMGIRTYQDAPPIPSFSDRAGRILISSDSILEGQVVFQKYALMNYGSMFGDGAGRGPDFTADALHAIAQSMIKFYGQDQAGALDENALSAIKLRAQRDLRQNNYDEKTNVAIVSDAQSIAIDELNTHYKNFFSGNGIESMHPAAYINNEKEIRDLASFFFWGAWVCSSSRPGHDYSYTHNWPFDPIAGNLPTAETTFWSVAGCMGLMLGLGAVLYLRGRLSMNESSPSEIVSQQSTCSASRLLDPAKKLMTIDSINGMPLYPSQKRTYKFFAVAFLLFFLQVLAGVLTIHDFVHFTNFAGFDIAKVLPLTVTRSWHLQLSLLWITACWMGSSLFTLPLLSKAEPKGQAFLTDVLFWMLIVLTVGSSAGILLGPMGLMKEWWLLGNQGWEFVELGKLWQGLLFVAFALWTFLIYRGIKDSLRKDHPIALPNWLFYSVLCVLGLFLAGFVATPKTNFVIADFWRWCVIHMWVEAFFEVFTTALIASFMYLMGLVTLQSASRTVYLSTLLFLGSGIIGISHNFYWNAKPVETLALGSIFSTLQVVPLILLTLEAFRLAHTPRSELKKTGEKSLFAHSDAYLFLLAVNFWNFMGAGVFGFIINLPIVNYYEHGTYLTVNHGHAALMGVYGNLAISAMLFCLRFLIPQSAWDSRCITFSFWSLNIGLSLMVLLDLFPAGMLQLNAVLEQGLCFARSQTFQSGTAFQTLTWLRIVGGSIFVVGGVVPLLKFVIANFPFSLQRQNRVESQVGQTSILEGVDPVH
ncbi:MAG: cbb3-type cytochrome c oxidase subunit I [Candidatus Melainabacteria bacterium]|jgi:nitric oxide reductase subunit B|nr:cbb3-type cytochrome c oxidase subunit I [Candidatus Melainabacteria bacterium]